MQMAFTMGSSKFRSRHCPYFPNPWDDPEDQIDDLVWLEAIDTDNLTLIAYYLRHSPVLHKPVLSALADKLNPQTKMAGRYLWKRAHGRPSRDTRSSRHSIGSALESGNLAFVAAQLRESPDLNRQIHLWLADQLDPASLSDSHIISRRARGRAPRNGGPYATRCAADTRRMFFGSMIERKHREFQKLEATLQYFMTKSAEVPNPVSRSKARRAYDYYHEKMGTKKSRL
jgi:hypothetical protein